MFSSFYILLLVDHIHKMCLHSKSVVCFTKGFRKRGCDFLKNEKINNNPSWNRVKAFFWHSKPFHFRIKMALEQYSEREAFCGGHRSNLICVSGLKRSIRTDFIKSLSHSDCQCWSVSTAQHSLTPYSTLSKNPCSLLIQYQSV